MLLSLFNFGFHFHQRPELMYLFVLWSLAAIASRYLQLASVEMVRHIYYLMPREMDHRGLLEVVFLQNMECSRYYSLSIDICDLVHLPSHQ